MTDEQIFEVNKMLAREFIEVHLDAKLSDENILYLANSIQHIERANA
jgi:hypothetical protein